MLAEQKVLFAIQRKKFLTPIVSIIKNLIIHSYYEYLIYSQLSNNPIKINYIEGLFQ